MLVQNVITESLEKYDIKWYNKKNSFKTPKTPIGIGLKVSVKNNHITRNRMKNGYNCSFHRTIRKREEYIQWRQNGI